MYSDILNTIRTAEDRDRLIDEIARLENAIYEPKLDFNSVLSKEVRAKTAELVRSGIGESSPEAYLQGLSKELVNIPTVKISLSFEPSEETIGVLLAWVRKNVGEGIIIEFGLEPQMIGGAKVAFGGKYYDGSIEKQLDSLL